MHLKIVMISCFLFFGWVRPIPIDISHVSVTLEVDHIRSDKGQLYIFLYNYENQYPDNPFKHLTFPKAGLKDKKMLCEVIDLPPGKYGLIIMDDENANNDLDRWLGIPKEGFCFSNMAKPRRFKFPKYEDILVEVGELEKLLNFRMAYIL